MSESLITELNNRGAALQRIANKYNEYIRLSNEHEQNFIQKMLPGKTEPWRMVQPEGSEYDIRAEFRNEETKDIVESFYIDRKYIKSNNSD